MLNVELGIRHSNWQFNIQHSTLNIKYLDSLRFPSQQTHKLLAGVQ